MSSKTLLGCSHNPKTILKKGTVNDTNFEILVCDDCKNDSDLENFEEVQFS